MVKRLKFKLMECRITIFPCVQSLKYQYLCFLVNLENEEQMNVAIGYFGTSSGID